jgi:hypothetical protein
MQTIDVQLRNDADGKLQKVSGWRLILCSDHYVFSLRIPFIKITMQTIDKRAGNPGYGFGHAQKYDWVIYIYNYIYKYFKVSTITVKRL